MGMNTSLRKSLRTRLMRRDGELCHYCECAMVMPGPRTAPDAMTLEHIVPQSYGGSDDITNLVLACSDCNNTRGNDLDFCWCERCKRVLDKWFARKFDSIINANRPRVKMHKGFWRVRVNKRTYSFVKWEHAIHFALTGENINV